jgi:trehalose synthase
VALIALPLASVKENALVVNALQRSASLVVQNSLQEGFGLTVTEAMWKRAAVLATNACGIRQQIRHGVDGELVADPTDDVELGGAIGRLLTSPWTRDAYGRSAQRRVHDEFLVFAQVRRWLHVLADCVRRSSSRSSS